MSNFRGTNCTICETNLTSSGVCMCGHTHHACMHITAETFPSPYIVSTIKLCMLNVLSYYLLLLLSVLICRSLVAVCQSWS